jgi:hypothetical protein
MSEEVSAEDPPRKRMDRSWHGWMELNEPETMTRGKAPPAAFRGSGGALVVGPSSPTASANESAVRGSAVSARTSASVRVSVPAATAAM